MTCVFYEAQHKLCHHLRVQVLLGAPVCRSDQILMKQVISRQSPAWLREGAHSVD